MSDRKLPEPPDQSQTTTGNCSGIEKHANPESTSERTVDATAQRQATLVEQALPGGEEIVAAERDNLVPVEATTIVSDALADNAKIEITEHQELGEAWDEVKRRCIMWKDIWEDKAQVKATLREFDELLKRKTPLAFDSCRLDASGFPDKNQKVFKVDIATDEREIWFLGDIHSDLLALESAIVFLEQRLKSTKIPICYVFLGDLFDDGAHGAATVLRVMRLILDNPYSVTVIAGNHDEALRYEDGKFSSSVMPCEFSEWLNETTQRDDSVAKQLGELTIDFFARCPRALFFSDGLLVAHGGVPLRDRWEGTAIDLNDPLCLQDFVWTRPHHRRKRTIPNRTKKGAGLGHEDFSAFCEIASKLLDVPVLHMIRGHDHVDKKERFESFEAYRRHPLLTINTLCRRLERESFGEYVRAPCIAKRVSGKLPEIHCLRIPDDLVRSIYPEQISDV